MSTQVLFVPIYLAHWGAGSYGLWLAAFALVSFTDMLFVGFQNYVGNEFLRLGFTEMRRVKKLFSTAIIVAGLLGGAQFVLLQWSIWSGKIAWFLGPDHLAQIHEFATVVWWQAIVSLFCGSIGGIAVRLLSALGYYSRMAWWSVCASFATSIGPVIAVALDAQLAMVGMVAALCGISFNMLMFWDMAIILRQRGFGWASPEIGLARQILWRSSAISCKTGFELLRQQGSRLLLAPLAGAAELTAFVTMRTGANLALQGIGTVTGPLLPELANFVRERDQQRCEIVFAVVWMVLLAVLIPGVVVLQAVVDPLFTFWTHGKVPFDPLVFAMLSAGVLVFAFVQPFGAVLQVVNHLSGQLGIAVVSGVVTLAGIGLLVPILELRGAALALLVAEVSAAIFTGYKCKSAMREAYLAWPGHSVGVVASAVLGGSGFILLMAILDRERYCFMGIALIASGYSVMRYYKTIPPLARARIRSLWSRWSTCPWKRISP